MITTAVAARRRLVNGYIFHGATVIMDRDLRDMPKTGAQRSTGAVVAHRAMFLVRVTVHYHRHRCTADQFHRYHLVIDNIIVAAVDATAVGTSFQRCAPAGIAQVFTEHGVGPKIWLFQVDLQRRGLFDQRGVVPIFQIDADGGKGTARLDGAAIRTAQRDFRSYTFWGVMFQRTERTQPLDRLRQIPSQDIQIVTTFGQNHRARALEIAPVAAYEAMRHVPIGYIFTVLNGDNLT